MRLMPLGEIANVYRGVTYSADEVSDVHQEEYVAVLRAGNIQDSLHIDTGLVFIPKSKVKKHQIIAKNDIVMCASSGSSDLVGKTAISQEDTNVTFGGFCLLIRATHGISCPSYINHYFRSNMFRSWAKQSQGINIKNIRKNELEELGIPLPPIEEQHRIAALLDKADAIRRKRQEALKLADDLVKSQFIEMFGDPVTNPKGWERGTIRDIADDVRYGTSKPASEHGKYTYLRMNNITYSGELDLSDLKSIDMPDNEVEKYIVRNGDVLFNRTNSKELVGKTCVFNSDTPMVIAGYIIRVRVNSRATPTYLSAFLNSDYGKLTLRGMCKSIIGQANINAQELQSIKILIPPLSLQTQFAAFVEQAYKSKFAMQRQLDEAESFRSSLMQQFFN